MVHLTRFVSVVAVMALLFATSLFVAVSDASAATGDCVTIKGKGGRKSQGYAVVCLTDWFASGGKQYAKVSVKQYRRSAPHNVYVKFGFVDEGTYNTGFKRLGPNANKDASYRRTKSFGNSNDMDGVQVRLCYDKGLFRRDPCFTKKLIWGSDGEMTAISA